MADLLGTVDQPSDVVELHHSTMHVKPPETGHPFPMHQDWAFYKHNDHRFVDVLVHLDDTRHENGEIRFLAGSHKQGPLEHVTIDPETGKGCPPHLPTDKYRLADTVAVPAKRGDIVVFNIFTIHGSHMNTTDRDRGLVRVGFNGRLGGTVAHGPPALGLQILQNNFDRPAYRQLDNHESRQPGGLGRLVGLVNETMADEAHAVRHAARRRCPLGAGRTPAVGRRAVLLPCQAAVHPGVPGRLCP